MTGLLPPNATGGGDRGEERALGAATHGGLLDQAGALGVGAPDDELVRGVQRRGVLDQQQVGEVAGRHGALLVERQHRGPVGRARGSFLEVAVTDARERQHREAGLGAVLAGAPGPVALLAERPHVARAVLGVEGHDLLDNPAVPVGTRPPHDHTRDTGDGLGRVLDADLEPLHGAAGDVVRPDRAGCQREPRVVDLVDEVVGIGARRGDHELVDAARPDLGGVGLAGRTAAGQHQQRDENGRDEGHRSSRPKERHAPGCLRNGGC